MNGTEPREKPHTLAEYSIDHFRYDLQYHPQNYPLWKMFYYKKFGNEFGYKNKTYSIAKLFSVTQQNFVNNDLIGKLFL